MRLVSVRIRNEVEMTKPGVETILLLQSMQAIYISIATLRLDKMSIREVQLRRGIYRSISTVIMQKKKKTLMRNNNKILATQTICKREAI